MFASIKQSARFYFDPIAFLTECQRDHGDYYRTRLGGKTIHFLFDPEDARSVLSDPLTFIKAQFVYNKIKPITGETGMVQIEGEEGLRLRSAFNTFFRGEPLETYLSNAQAVVEASAPDFEGVHDVRGPATELVFQTALSMFAGAEPSEQAGEITEHFLQLNDFCAREFRNLLPIANPVRKVRIKSVQRQLHAALVQFVHAPREGSLLHRIQEAEADIPMEVCETFLLNQVKTFLFAGHETTAAYLIMALFELARDPALQEQVRNDYTDGEAGSLTQAFLREILRIHPPAWLIVRESTKEGQLGDHRYRAGDYFFLGVYQMHRHPAHWPHPEELNLHNHQQKSIAFLPYGFGKRHCIGSRLADLEVQMILDLLLSRYQLTLDGPDQIATKVMITAYPADPVRIRFRPH